MNKWLKVACVIASLVVAGGAAALPGQCDEVCNCTVSCSTPCAIGGMRTTCGAYGDCVGLCRSAGVVTASATAGPDAADPLLARILGQAVDCAQDAARLHASVD